MNSELAWCYSLLKLILWHTNVFWQLQQAHTHKVTIWSCEWGTKRQLKKNKTKISSPSFESKESKLARFPSIKPAAPKESTPSDSRYWTETSFVTQKACWGNSKFLNTLTESPHIPHPPWVKEEFEEFKDKTIICTVGEKKPKLLLFEKPELRLTCQSCTQEPCYWFPCRCCPKTLFTLSHLLFVSKSSKRLQMWSLVHKEARYRV